MKNSIDKKQISVRNKSFQFYWDNFGTVIILVVMFVLVSFFTPSGFLSGGNIIQIFMQSTTSNINII